MAEIDKGLPNTRTELKVPAPEQEVDVTEQQEQKGPVEVLSLIHISEPTRPY